MSRSAHHHKHSPTHTAPRHQHKNRSPNGSNSHQEDCPPFGTSHPDRIHLGKLDMDMSEEEVKCAFSNFEITDVKLIKKKEQTECFGFVTFKYSNDVSRLVEPIGQTIQIRGRRFRISRAVSKSQANEENSPPNRNTRTYVQAPPRNILAEANRSRAMSLPNIQASQSQPNLPTPMLGNQTAAFFAPNNYPLPFAYHHLQNMDFQQIYHYAVALHQALAQQQQHNQMISPTHVPAAFVQLPTQMSGYDATLLHNYHPHHVYQNPTPYQQQPQFQHSTPPFQQTPIPASHRFNLSHHPSTPGQGQAGPMGGFHELTGTYAFNIANTSPTESNASSNVFSPTQQLQFPQPMHGGGH